MYDYKSFLAKIFAIVRARLRVARTEPTIAGSRVNHAGHVSHLWSIGLGQSLLNKRLDMEKILKFDMLGQKSFVALSFHFLNEQEGANFFCQCVPRFVVFCVITPWGRFVCFSGLL